MLNVLHRLVAPVLPKKVQVRPKKYFAGKTADTVASAPTAGLLGHSQAPPQSALSTNGQTKAPSAALNTNRVQLTWIIVLASAAFM
jgi:hypothetical protein